MRYAMTGATGFLGGELAAQLRSSGHDLVALVRDPARATDLRDLGVELVGHSSVKLTSTISSLARPSRRDRSLSVVSVRGVRRIA